MTAPAVSICIPTYNYAHFLGDAIGSALLQSYRDLEIVVSDNCSTDGTPELVARLMRQDPRIVYHRNEHNIGMVGNFNRCLELARGRYVKFLCADDMLGPACVARMVEVLDRHEDIALVTCGRVWVDDGGARPLRYAGYARRSVRVPGDQVMARCFFYGNLIGEPTAVMFRRAAAGRLFSDRYTQLMDLEMWFHLLRQGSLEFLREALCSIRQHAGQATQENVEWGAVLEDKRELFKEFHAKAAVRASLLKKASWDLRMAVTVRRTSAAGLAISPREIDEVFFSRVFRRLTYPLVSALWTAQRPRPPREQENPD
jgi:glycosyltransferase involved in cell wall biosynthesis